MKKLTFINPDVTIKLTRTEAESLGIDLSKVENNQLHAEMSTRGPWSIIDGYRALTVAKIYDSSGMFTKIKETTIFGMRSLSDIKPGGYELEGRVSIGGKKYTAFTSSQLFEIEGQLIDIATIHARVN